MVELEVPLEELVSHWAGEEGEIPVFPDDLKKKYKGKRIGKPGGGFLEIFEK